MPIRKCTGVIVSGISRMYSPRRISSNDTISSVCQQWISKFIAAKIDEPEDSINNIIAHVRGINQPSQVSKYYQDVLSVDQISQINTLSGLRLKRMPIQYVIGEWQFRDLPVKLRPPVFIPRPETEQLVDFVAQHCDIQRRQQIRLLELCCGSGVISLALLKAHPQMIAVAVDYSSSACDLTRENAVLNGVETRLEIFQEEISPSNLLNKIDRKFDVIVSNPPYVPSADINGLQPEILQYEDLAALDGGPTGLTIIMLLLHISANKLESGGRLFLEVDPRQPRIIKEYLDANTSMGLCYVNTYVDFCNKDRFIEIAKK